MGLLCFGADRDAWMRQLQSVSATAFLKDHRDWDQKLESGDLSFIREWLKKNIHQWGRTYNAEELVKKVTGKALSEEAYCSYLKKKYSQIYDL